MSDIFGKSNIGNMYESTSSDSAVAAVPSRGVLSELMAVAHCFPVTTWRRFKNILDVNVTDRAAVKLRRNNFKPLTTGARLWGLKGSTPEKVV